MDLREKKSSGARQRAARPIVLLATIGLGGCTAGPQGPDLSASVGITFGTTSTESTGSGTAGASDDSGGPSSPGFDLGQVPDAGPGNMGPVIPATCDQALAGASSVGCTFYAVDMDSSDDTQQFAVAVANVQTDVTANVTVQTRDGGAWTDVQGPTAVTPLSLAEFALADRHQEGTGIRTAGAYRVVSDVPIVAYQFQPINGAVSFLSDASMLYPVPAWDWFNHAINVSFHSSTPGAGYPYLTIVAAEDGTNVSFTAANATIAGGPIPAAGSGQTIELSLDDGDVATIVAAFETATLSGSLIVTDEDHPVAVLPGHTCVNIPDDTCCCDHLEEQLSGVRQWGRSFVAAHMPYRNAGDPEPTFWQVYASLDDTTVTFSKGATVTGVPGQLTLNAGEVAEFFAQAPMGVGADFSVDASKPVAVVGYMTSAEMAGEQILKSDMVGDPAMAQFVPVEQFLPRYVVLVPGTWVNDVLVLTRPAGATITIDGDAVDDAVFRPVGDGTYEVAHVPVGDGVHVLDGGDERFGVVVVGWDVADSYAYVGGTGTDIINPNPEG